MNRPCRITVIILLLALTTVTLAAEKKYQTTKVIEVSASRREFCLVVQLDDLAYVSVAHEHVPSNLIVGDPIQVRVKNDNLWVRVNQKWLYDADEVKTNIVVRKRMVGDMKLPSCSLSVTLH